MNGVVVAKIIRALERYYEANAEDVQQYVSTHDDETAREVLLVREDDAGMELALVLPSRVAASPWQTLTLDERCQVVEGASHFLMVCERARNERSTTQLELELQAEIDKWLVLSNAGRLGEEDDQRLRSALYEQGSFLHVESSTEGERYRLANNLAARFTHKLARSYARLGRHDEMRLELLRFYRMSQEEKLRAIAA